MAPEHEATAKHWKAEHTGKEKQKVKKKVQGYS
jgi:hypothetical protein